MVKSRAEARTREWQENNADVPRYEILKVLVGSRAHGLETPESDTDYRSVFAVPTPDLLKMHAPRTFKGWQEGEDEDASGYEVGHFLELASTSNPSILEVFRAPIQEPELALTVSSGQTLQNLFQYTWTAQRVADAFGGYSHNQRKKFLENKDGRQWKFAVAYLRVLLQGIELLSTGDFSVKIKASYPGFDNPYIMNPYLDSHYHQQRTWNGFLRAVKQGTYSKGIIIDIAESLRIGLDDLALTGPFKDHQKDEAPLNKFLLEVRGELW